MLFNKTRDRQTKQHITAYWDERLYKSLFATKEAKDHIGRYFSCRILSRESKLDPQESRAVEHKYYGNMRVELDKDEYSNVLVQIAFEKPHDYFDMPMNDVNLGYASFGWMIHSDSYISDTRKRPCIHISIKDTNNLSESISKLFVESKTAGGAGLDLLWSMNIESMVEQSAQAVWGAWDDLNDNISEYPGRKSFHLVSLQFTATV